MPGKRARALTWALALEAEGRPAEELPHAQAALDREPTDTSAAVLVRVLLAVGRSDEAARLVSGHPWTDAVPRARAEGAVALARSDHGSAIDSFQRAFQQAGSAEDARQAARAMVRGGQSARAAAWLGELAGRGVTAEGDPELERVLLGSGSRSCVRQPVAPR